MRSGLARAPLLATRRAARAGFLVLAIQTATVTAEPEGSRWLEVRNVRVDQENVRFVLENRSGRLLHVIDPLHGELANYLKVGFEAMSPARAAADGSWADTRPDLDPASASIGWVDLREQLSDLVPGQPAEVVLSLPAKRILGRLDLIVLARRGDASLNYRRTLDTRVAARGDILRGLLGLIVLLAAGGLWSGWRRRQRRNPRRALSRLQLASLTATVTLLGAGVLYSVAAWLRAAPIYRYLKSSGARSQRPGLVIDDSELGFRPAPGATGAYEFPGGFRTTLAFSPEGFREPRSLGRTGDEQGRGCLLALGDSFSLGDACEAEECFPWRVARGLGFSSVDNTAFSSYGLGQMLLQGERWIPERRPTVVLAQYSTWLVDRAESPFAPTTMGVVTAPYFIDAGSGLSLAPPIFQTPLLALYPGRFHGSPASLLDRFRFFYRFALPYHVALDARMTRDLIRRTLGQRPAPTRRRLAVLSEVYGRLADRSRLVGARFVIVLLGKRGPGPSDDIDILARIPGVTLVDAEARLEAAAAAASPGDPKAAYSRMFAVWAGSPERLVDEHPNAEANRVIADAILAALQSAPAKTQRQAALQPTP